MFIELTAYGYKRLINTDHIVQVWPEKKYGKPNEKPSSKVVTRVQLTNDIIDVAESYAEVLQIIKGI